MSGGEWIVVAVVAGALIATLTNRLRGDLIGLLAMLTLGLSGVITPQAATAGFGSNVTLTLIGLFIISQGLEETGIVQGMAVMIRRLGGGSETKLVLIVMLAGGSLSLIMNNIAAAAVLLPAVLYAARESTVPPSRLLIPLAFGVMLGGMATYFTTANIVLSDQLVRQGFNGLGMVDFLPTGGLIALVGIGFMTLYGRHLLPRRETLAAQSSTGTINRQLFETYQISERLWELRVPPGIPLDGTALRDSGIGADLGLTVLAIWRGHHALLTPGPDDVIMGDDLLLVLGREDRIEGLIGRGLEFGRPSEIDAAQLPRRAQAVALTEVVIPPRSSMIGRTLMEVRFRNRYGLTSVALWREGRSYRTDVGRFRLEVGDALLMVGPASAVAGLATDRDYLVTSSSHTGQPPNRGRAGWAVIIMLITFGLAIFRVIPTWQAVMIGGVAMVLTRCLTMDEAYRAIEWRAIFQIAGMSAISVAMIETGLAERVGGGVVNGLSPLGSLGLIGGLFLVVMLLTQAIGGQSSALIAAPIAVAAAAQTGIDPAAVAVAVAIACSTSFLTLTAHPVNVLVVGPGGYRPADFVRVGLMMTVITFVLMMVGMWVFWGVR